VFARGSGQSFLEVLQWHPRDIDTWLAEATAEREQQEQDERFAQLQREHQEGR
jgi:hypothetical protein